MTFTRVINKVAIDVSAAPALHYTPNIAAQFEDVPDGVVVGSVLLQNISAGALVAGESWHLPGTFIQEYLPGTYRYALRAAAVGPTYTPPVSARHITEWAFRKRFTFGERVTLQLTAVDNPVALAAAANDTIRNNMRMASATVRTFLEDARSAIYIDLDLQDTIEGLAALEAAGLIAPGRADEILLAPVQPNEQLPGQ